MALHAPNVFIQEIVRAFYYGWYQDLVTELPPIENGMITVPEGPGLGTELNPDVMKRPDAVSNEPRPKISREANGMKVVLAYGYSNVWEAKPIEAIDSPEHHPHEVRWTNALQHE